MNWLIRLQMCHFKRGFRTDLYLFRFTLFELLLFAFALLLVMLPILGCYRTYVVICIVVRSIRFTRWAENLSPQPISIRGYTMKRYRASLSQLNLRYVAAIDHFISKVYFFFHFFLHPEWIARHMRGETKTKTMNSSGNSIGIRGFLSNNHKAPG